MASTKTTKTGPELYCNYWSTGGMVLVLWLLILTIVLIELYGKYVEYGAIFFSVL